MPPFGMAEPDAVNYQRIKQRKDVQENIGPYETCQKSELPVDCTGDDHAGYDHHQQTYGYIFLCMLIQFLLCNDPLFRLHAP